MPLCNNVYTTFNTPFVYLILTNSRNKQSIILQINRMCQQQTEDKELNVDNSELSRFWSMIALQHAYDWGGNRTFENWYIDRKTQQLHIARNLEYRQFLDRSRSWCSHSIEEATHPLYTGCPSSPPEHNRQRINMQSKLNVSLHMSLPPTPSRITFSPIPRQDLIVTQYASQETSGFRQGEFLPDACSWSDGE